MREKRSGGGARVTCDDCYFRQELLCALDLDAVCPTFRATVGRHRRPAAPKQAQLVELAAVTRPQPIVRPAAAMQSTVPGQLAGPTHQPFAEGAPEATFSLSDMREPSWVLRARDAIHPTAPNVRRAAAAGRVPAQVAVVVPVSADDEPEQLAIVGSVAAGARGGRVSRRVAARYPNAASLPGFDA